MRIARATAIGILLLSMLALGGCKKKKPAVPQPQSQAPTITQPQPETPPPAPAASEPNRPEPEEVKPETATAPPPTVTPPKPKPKPRPPAAAKKTPPPPPPAPEKPGEKQPSKTIVNDGGTQPATPQLSASVSPDTAVHQKFNTAQLLEATDSNLKSISRQLNTDEQAMVQHIRSYMQQSRDASKEGDTERAYNLAMKAHLLSDELVKR
jgi:outer membrane biosynthesis protein TonB